MNLDALFPNLATGRLLGRQADTASQDRRDADGADAGQFAALLSDLDDRSVPAARATVDDSTAATTDRSDDRAEHPSVGDEAAVADAPSNAPAQMQAFVAVPAFDMNWSPSAPPQPRPARSNSEHSTSDAAPARDDGSESTPVDGGAPVSNGYPASAVAVSRPPSAFATDARAADDERVASRASSAAISRSPIDALQAATPDPVSTQRSTPDSGGPTLGPRSQPSAAPTMGMTQAPSASSDSAPMRARMALAQPSAGTPSPNATLAESATSSTVATSSISDIGSTFGRIAVEPGPANVGSVSDRDANSPGGDGADLVSTTELRNASAAEASPRPSSSAAAQWREPLTATAPVDDAASWRTTRIDDMNRPPIETIDLSAILAPQSSSIVATRPSVDWSTRGSASSLASAFDVEASGSGAFVGAIRDPIAAQPTAPSAPRGRDAASASSMRDSPVRSEGVAVPIGLSGADARGLSPAPVGAPSEDLPVDRQLASSDASGDLTSPAPLTEPRSIEVNSSAPTWDSVRQPMDSTASNEATFAGATRDRAVSSFDLRSVSPATVSASAPRHELPIPAPQSGAARSTSRAVATGDGGLVSPFDLRGASASVASASARTQNVETSESPADPSRTASATETSVSARTQEATGLTISSDVTSPALYASAFHDGGSISPLDLRRASTTPAPTQRQDGRAYAPPIDGAPSTPSLTADDSGGAFSRFDPRPDATSEVAPASIPTQDYANPAASSERRSSPPRVDAVQGASAFAPFDLRSLSSSAAPASTSSRDSAGPAPFADAPSSTRRADSDRSPGAFAPFDLRSATTASTAPASAQTQVTASPAILTDDRSSTLRVEAVRGGGAFSPYDLRSDASAAAAPASAEAQNAVSPGNLLDDRSSTLRAEATRGGGAFSPHDLRNDASAAVAPVMAQPQDAARPAASSDDRSSTLRSEATRGGGAFSPHDLRTDVSAAVAPASSQTRDAANPTTSSDGRSSTLRAETDRGEGAFFPFDLRRGASAAASVPVLQSEFASVATQSDVAAAAPYAAAIRDVRPISPFDLGSASARAGAAPAQTQEFAPPAPQFDIASSTTHAAAGRDGAAATPFDLRGASEAAVPASTSDYARSALDGTGSDLSFAVVADAANVARDNALSAAPQGRPLARPAADGARASGDALSAFVPDSRDQRTTAPFAVRPAFEPIASATDFERAFAQGGRVDDSASTASVVVNRRAAPIETTSTPQPTAPSFASAVSDQTAQSALSSSFIATGVLSADDQSSSPQDLPTILATSDPQTTTGWRPSAQAGDGGSRVFAASSVEPVGAPSVAAASRAWEVTRQPPPRPAADAAPTASTASVDDTPRTADVSFVASSAAPVVATPTRDREATLASVDRVSTNDRRSSASGVADPLYSSPVNAAPVAVARGADETSSNGDRGSDRRAFAETSGRLAPSVELRPTAFAAGDHIQAPAGPSLTRPDASNVSTTPSAASVDETSTNESAPEPIGTLAILAPPAQLPSAFAELLAPPARSLIASATIAPAAGTAATRAAPVAEAQRQSVAPKILTIELEPASLGSVVVKMKLAHSGIDMRISVTSTEALHRLDSTRDRLVEAMQSSGCTIDSCTIQIGQNAADGGNAQAAPDSGAGFAQSGGAGAGREEQGIGREGAGYGGQGGDRRRGAGGEINESTSNGEIRRVADRRGGDVYL